MVMACRAVSAELLDSGLWLGFFYLTIHIFIGMYYMPLKDTKIKAYQQRYYIYNSVDYFIDVREILYVGVFQQICFVRSSQVGTLCVCHKSE